MRENLPMYQGSYRSRRIIIGKCDVDIFLLTAARNMMSSSTTTTTTTTGTTPLRRDCGWDCDICISLRVGVHNSKT
jgi:hypothetical protein